MRLKYNKIIFSNDWFYSLYVTTWYVNKINIKIKTPSSNAIFTFVGKKMEFYKY